MVTLPPRQVGQVREGEADAVLIAKRLRQTEALIERQAHLLGVTRRFQQAPSQVLKSFDQTSLIPRVSKESDTLLGKGDLVRPKLTPVRRQLADSEQHPGTGLDLRAGRVSGVQDRGQPATSFGVVATSPPVFRQVSR